MVFPHDHILIRYNGHFGTTGTDMIDRWSVGMRFGLTGSEPVYDAAKLQTFTNACDTAAKVFHAAAGSLTGTNCWYNWATGAQIGVLGKYVPPGQLTVISPWVGTAGSGTPINPWNTALVVSLRTSQPRGVASNGRLYWPAIAAPVVNTTGRLTTAVVNTRVNLFKTFLDACNTAANAYSPNMRLIVASSIGGGKYATVQSIRSDQRLDSIERRENAAPATWSTAALS
jgi:hypothetical protein